MELINNPSNIEWDLYATPNWDLDPKKAEIEDLLFFGSHEEALKWTRKGYAYPFYKTGSSRKHENNIKAFFNEFEPYRKVFMDNICKCCTDERYKWISITYIHRMIIGDPDYYIIDLKTREFHKDIIRNEDFDKVYWNRFKTETMKIDDNEYSKLIKKNTII